MGKKNWIFSAIFCMAVAIIVIYFNKNEVNQIPLYHQVDFNTVSNSDSWEKFREKMEISILYSKIENFKLIVDKNKNIHSVRFDIVDKVNGKFEIYHYQNCFVYEFEEENQVQITRSTSDDWIQYERMIKATEFFLKLDFLKQEKFLKNRENDFIFIHSRGWNEGIGYEGDYFVLENRSLKVIDKTENILYKGVSLQVMGNNLPSNFSTDNDTDTVFISNFTKEKLN